MKRTEQNRRISYLDLNRRLAREQRITWGCPDGLNAHDYDGHETWDVSTWRWEFLRRRYVIRNLFGFRARDDFAERNGKLIAPHKAMWLPEYKDRVFGLSPADAALYGIGTLSNPLYAKEPEGLSFLEARTLRPFDIGANDRYSKIGPRQIAIVFDPDKPLEPQLEGIGDYLASHRNHNTPTDIQRIHAAKYLEYIRILDAREAGHSWKRCAEDILPVTSARTPQAARDVHRQAVRVQEDL